LKNGRVTAFAYQKILDAPYCKGFGIMGAGTKLKEKKLAATKGSDLFIFKDTWKHR